MRDVFFTGGLLLAALLLVWAGLQARDSGVGKITCSVLDQETGALSEKTVWILDPELLEACERGAVITAADIAQQSARE